MSTPARSPSPSVLGGLGAGAALGTDRAERLAVKGLALLVALSLALAAFVWWRLLCEDPQADLAGSAAASAIDRSSR